MYELVNEVKTQFTTCVQPAIELTSQAMSYQKEIQMMYLLRIVLWINLNLPFTTIDLWTIVRD